MLKFNKKQAILITLTLVLELGLAGCGKNPLPAANSNYNQNQNVNVNDGKPATTTDNRGAGAEIDKLILQIDDWNLYQASSRKDILNFNSCGDNKFDALLEKVKQGEIYELRLNGVLDLVYTPNYDGWSNADLKYHESFCQAGAIYPRYAYQDKILWAGVCSSGVLPEKTDPGYRSFQRCTKAEEALNNFLQNQNSNFNTNAATTTEEIDTSNWKTYQNKEYGFEFNYPREWGYLLNGTGTIGFGKEFFGMDGEDLPLFDADFLIYPSFDKKYFDFERTGENISETTFKNNQGLIFTLLDGITSGQDPQLPTMRWRNYYYLRQNDSYFHLSCLNQIYDATQKKWLIRNSENFCDDLARQLKITQ